MNQRNVERGKPIRSAERQRIEAAFDLVRQPDRIGTAHESPDKMPAPFATTVDAAAANPAMLEDYELLELLGQGGMGAVYKARHRRLNRLVALKLLREDRADNPEAAQRFAREMAAIGRLPPHPNVVLATDARLVDGVPLLAMEYVEGLDLAYVVRNTGPLQVRDACELVHQVACGLEHIGAAKLVHRDIKPRNLLLTPAGIVKILDLGLARIVTASQESLTALTQVGDVLGTPDFMAPEQWLDTRRVDIRADLYSLGCTLYFLLTGRGPFDDLIGRGLSDRRGAHLQATVPSLTVIRPDASPELDALLHDLLAKAPEDRPASPQVVIQRLRHLREGSDVTGLYVRAAQRMPMAVDRSTPATAAASLRPHAIACGPSPGTAAATDPDAGDAVLRLHVSGTRYTYEPLRGARSYSVGRQRRKAGGPPDVGNDLVIRVSGSAESTLRISRQHFRIERTETGHFITDLSKAGTFLNGHRLPLGQPVEMRAGDTILVAGLLTLHAWPPAPRTTAPRGVRTAEMQPPGMPVPVVLEATLGDVTTVDPDDGTTT